MSNLNPNSPSKIVVVAALLSLAIAPVSSLFVIGQAIMPDVTVGDTVINLLLIAVCMTFWAVSARELWIYLKQAIRTISEDVAEEKEAGRVARADLRF